MILLKKRSNLQQRIYKIDIQLKLVFYMWQPMAAQDTVGSVEKEVNNGATIALNKPRQQATIAVVRINDSSVVKERVASLTWSYYCK